MTDKYPDSTLDVKFQSIEDKMDEQFEATTQVLAKMLEQTTKTNGSVKGLQLWRSYILGGMTILGLMVIPAIGFLGFQVIQNQSNIAGLTASVQEIANIISQIKN